MIATIVFCAVVGAIWSVTAWVVIRDAPDWPAMWRDAQRYAEREREELLLADVDDLAVSC